MGLKNGVKDTFNEVVTMVTNSRRKDAFNKNKNLINVCDIKAGLYSFHFHFILILKGH